MFNTFFIEVLVIHSTYNTKLFNLEIRISVNDSLFSFLKYNFSRRILNLSFQFSLLSPLSWLLLSTTVSFVHNLLLVYSCKADFVLN